jgi:hypothetical protein
VPQFTQDWPVRPENFAECRIVRGGKCGEVQLVSSNNACAKSTKNTNLISRTTMKTDSLALTSNAVEPTNAVLDPVTIAFEELRSPNTDTGFASAMGQQTSDNELGRAIEK